SMEEYIDHERNDIKDLKENLNIREKESVSKLKEAQEIERGIIEMEQKRILEDRQDLDDLDFRKYLHSKIEKPQAPEVNKVVQDFHLHIDKCRDMIRQNQINDAKRMYNEIKRRFSQANVNPTEKENLYNSIRELYDDIYLSIIGHS
ncbi:hypothetical protein ACFLTH_18065, partial [Bacteroidota bacterium]